MQSHHISVVISNTANISLVKADCYKNLHF